MKVEILHGDCMEQMVMLIERGVTLESCVTDPPYHLTSGKSRAGGFMGKKWDGGGIAQSVELWQLVYALLKPGGHLLAFSGTRTYHRMACAIEDAGFEIRDCIRSLNGQDHYPAWAYGQGFPKSLDISRNIDKAAGVERKVIGDSPFASRKPNGTWNGNVYGDEPSHNSGPKLTAPATPEAQQWAGWGTALKPAWEPVCLARKPLSEPTLVANVLRHGTGGLNIDGCKVPAPDSVLLFKGRDGNSVSAYADGLNGSNRTGDATTSRWPANLIHDGSDEILEEFARFGDRSSPWIGNAKGVGRKGGKIFGGGEQRRTEKKDYQDTGTAARFFYSAKASRLDRSGSKHPTIKPLSLMQYLCRLVTPPGGTVLDPFAGSGTTLAAAYMEGFNSIGIERETEYITDIRRRIASLQEPKSQPARQGGLFDDLIQTAPSQD